MEGCHAAFPSVLLVIHWNSEGMAALDYLRWILHGVQPRELLLTSASDSLGGKQIVKHETLSYTRPTPVVYAKLGPHAISLHTQGHIPQDLRLSIVHASNFYEADRVRADADTGTYMGLFEHMMVFLQILILTPDLSSVH